MCGVSTQQWPSTQICLFERTCQSAWLDAVTTRIDKKQVNCCVKLEINIPMQTIFPLSPRFTPCPGNTDWQKYWFPVRDMRLRAHQTWHDPKTSVTLNLISMEIWGDLKSGVMLNLNCPKIWGEVKIWGDLKPDVVLNLNCPKIWVEVKSSATQNLNCRKIWGGVKSSAQSNLKTHLFWRDFSNKQFRQKNSEMLSRTRY